MTNHQADAVTGAVWMFGLAGLFYTGLWWPGILVVVGVSILIQGLVRGQRWAALNGSLWMFGIAAWAYYGYSMVVFFIVLGCSILLNAFVRPPFLPGKPKAEPIHPLE